MMSTVELVGLRKAYDATVVLDDFSLRADEGEFVTLLGPSGCGKTTTLRCIAGLERAEQGEVHVGGRLVASAEHRVFVPPNRRDVGMVFQSYALWPHMTVFANVAYPLRVRRRDRAEVRRAVMDTLAAVGMDSYAQRPVTDLSGGQQQRVALARAMVSRPRVLLFDEPLSNLDATLRRSMRKELRDAHDLSGGTSVYVTHDQEEAITLSDRVVVMQHGTIQQVGTPRAIYREPVNRFVAGFIGFENLLPATVSETRDGATGVRLRSGPGPVWAGLGVTPVKGTGVVLAARADELELGPLGASAQVPAGAVSGVVRSSFYAGGRVEYVLEVAGGAVDSVVVRAPDLGVPDDRLAVGRDAWVRFPAEHTVLVEDDRAGRREEAEPEQTIEPIARRG